jgi:hypothetical protein
MAASGICLPGCRTRGAALTTSPETATTAVHSFHALRTLSLKYQTLSARLHVELATGTEKLFSSQAVLKIRRDRILQLSIQPFAGIEVMRFECSPDSFRILDRINKRYMADAFANLKGDMQPALNFYNLQALFTNRIFLPGETEWPDDAFLRFRCEPDAPGYIFRTQGRDGLDYLFTSRNERLCSTEIADNARRVLHLDYDAFGLVGEQSFPTEINAEWRVNGKTKGSMAVRYSNIDLDRPLDFRFDIPKNYEQVDPAQILKLIGTS